MSNGYGGVDVKALELELEVVRSSLSTPTKLFYYYNIGVVTFTRIECTIRPRNFRAHPWNLFWACCTISFGICPMLYIFILNIHFFIWIILGCFIFTRHFFMCTLMNPYRHYKMNRYTYYKSTKLGPYSKFDLF